MISAKCEGNVTSVYAHIHPTSHSRNLTKSGDAYKVGYTPPLIGSYNVKVFCSDGNVTLNSSIDFLVSNLTLNFSHPSIAFRDQTLEIRAKLVKTSNFSEEIKSNVSFEVLLNEKPVEKKEDLTYFNPSTNEWIITTKELLNFSPGNYTLKLISTYNQKNVSKLSSLLLKNPLEIKITPEKNYLIGSGNLTLSYTALYRSSAVTLSLSNLEVKLEDKSLEIQEVADKIIIKMPELKPGSYELKVKANYYGAEATDSKIIDYVVPISGKIFDSSGKAVSGELHFIKDGETKIIRMAGTYSDYVKKGNYTIKAIFPKTKITFFNVGVEENLENIIRFDSIGEVPSLEGFRIAASAAIEFKPSFSRVLVEMEYDASKVRNEEDLKVFKCLKWNLDAKICSSDWEKLEVKIDTIDNAVSFESTSLSAFVVGEPKSLVIKSKLDKSNYFASEDIQVNGIVEDDTGNPVKDASVEITLLNQTIKTETNSEGLFSSILFAPQEDGEYYVKISARKMPFNSTTRIERFKVEKRKDFTLLIPSKANVMRGVNSSLLIRIVNNGQTTLHNFIIDVSGMPSHSEFSPKKFEKLEPKEEVPINLVFNVQSTDKNEYLISVRVRSDEIEKRESFVLYVENKTAEEKALLPWTGLIIFPPLDILVAAISVPISFIIIIFVARKVKLKVSKRRSDVENLLNNIKEEIRSLPKEKKEEKKQSLNKQDFGANAGKVWNALKSKGPLSLDEIMKDTQLKMEEVFGALGWLGREGKIQIIDEGKDLFYKLTE